MIGITKTSLWLPKGFEDSHFISQQSSVPEFVIREKMGIKQKCRAKKETQTSWMAIKACEKLLVNEDRDSIDLIIWTGSEYKDHPVWSAGIFIQEALGLKNAYAFDVAARCSTNVLGLKLAKDMMNSDKTINKVLLCGGHKTGELVNYKDENARFLYNLSDGASAVLIERDKGTPILESKFITDGSFSKDVIIPAGGTHLPMRDGVKYEDTFLCVPDISGMRERLAQKSLNNFLTVIKEAAIKSMNKPIDYLAILHMKKSIHNQILNSLELGQEQSIYLDEYGHFGAPDQILSLALAEEQGKLKKGDHVVLASAGIGYTWSAISLEWKGPLSVNGSLNKEEK